MFYSRSHDSSNEHTVFLSLGANIGDRQRNIEQALQRLGNVVTIQAISSLYETVPIGEGGKPLSYNQPLFLNLVCQGRTKLEPGDLLAALKEIEEAMGRLPSFRNAPRPIDIDILLYDNLQVTLPQLIIPHPRMRERAFVLIPMVEIAPLTIEPNSGQTMQEIATNLSTQGVHKTALVLVFKNPPEP